MKQRANSEHYLWGDGCEGWLLANDPQLTVIEERMPPRTFERLHHHQTARQFFFVLDGELTMALESRTECLQAGQGLEIAPMTAHQARNDGTRDVRFLVISSPTTRGDRIEGPRHLGASSSHPEAEAPPSTLQTTPVVPTVAVLAVVVRQGRVLLVRRANPPDAGLWGFPGGKVEPGETLAQAAVRELEEETTVTGSASRVMAALDAFDRDEQGVLLHHYVLVPVVCTWLGGEPAAQDDALDARWFDHAELEGCARELSRDVFQLACQALRCAAAEEGGDSVP